MVMASRSQKGNHARLEHPAGSIRFLSRPSLICTLRDVRGDLREALVGYQVCHNIWQDHTFYLKHFNQI